MASPEASTRPARKWLAVSLRAAMVPILVLAVWMASVTNRARRQARIIEGLRDRRGAVGGNCGFDFQFVGGHANGKEIPNARIPGRESLRRWIGDEYFRKVVRVHLSANFSSDLESEQGTLLPDEERLRLVSGLEGLESFGLYLWDVNDETLAAISSLPKLRSLQLSWCNGLSDKAFAYLDGLDRLEEVCITNCRFNGAGLAHLARLPRLRTLDLSFDGIDDTSLSYLNNMSRLRVLRIAGVERQWRTCAPMPNEEPSFTDRGLASIAQMVSLQELTLGESAITDEGVARLKSLNKLTILSLSSRRLLTDRALEHVQELKSLETLVLNECYEEFPEFSQKGLRRLIENLPRLTSLLLPRRINLDIGELSKLRPNLVVGYAPP